MEKKQLLLDKVKDIPEPLIDEVLDFIDFLTARRAGVHLLPGGNMAEDKWLSPKGRHGGKA